MKSKCVEVGSMTNSGNLADRVSRFCHQWLQHHTCGKWHLMCKKVSICSCISNQNPWLHCKGNVG